MPTYWCCLYTRDGATTLEKTLASVIAQTVKPSYILVVNDGSTDSTSSILYRVSSTYGNLQVISTLSKTRDIRRAPQLLNLALEASKLRSKTDCMMITGDDCYFPLDYASNILERMGKEETLVVASGDWGMTTTMGLRKLPQGAGRFVKTSFMERLSNSYPVAYGWESWLLFKAMQLGFRVQAFDDIRYHHLRPYRPGNVLNWGRGMHSLGYPFYFVILRFLKNLLLFRRGIMTAQANISALAGYIASIIGEKGNQSLMIQDQTLRSFVSWTCARRAIGPFMRFVSNQNNKQRWASAEERHQT